MTVLKSTMRVRERRALVACVMLAVVAMAAAPANAQQPNQAQASLTFNGTSGPPWPATATVSTPGTLTIDVAGTAIGAPFTLYEGPLNAGAFTSGNGQIVDIGTPPTFSDIAPILDGTQPGFPNALAFLGVSGTAQIVISIPSGVTPGSYAFQCGVIDPTHPDGVAVSGATDLTIVPPLNYGSIAYSAGPDVSSHAGSTSTAPGPPTAWPGLSPDFDIEVMGLAGFQPLSSSGGSGVHPYWRRQLGTLGGIQAMHVGRNGAFPYQKTFHGDLYCYQDKSTSPDTFGFMLAQGGMVPTPLAATVIQGTGSAEGTNQPWQTEVAIHGNLLMAVEDREAVDPIAPGQNDRVRLFTLDGVSLAATSQPSADITPATPSLVGIAAESLTLTADHLFFVGSVSNSTPATGLLFSAPTDGTVATQVTVPDVAVAGTAPTVIDGEFRYSDDRTMIVFQGGTSTTEEDLYVIRDITPGGFNILNLSAFASSTEIEEFGDASDGLDNQVAISTGNAQVAFVTRDAGSDELWVVATDGMSPAVQVSVASNFAPEIDDIIELWWADDDNLLFFAGTTSVLTDLYRYEVSTGLVYNITQTNGQTTVPFTGTPASTIDNDGTWKSLNGNYLYFLRDTPGNAPQLVLNIVGVDLLLFLPTDITGSEFSAGTAPAIKFPTVTGMELAYAPMGDHMVFVAEVITALDDDLWSFDAENAAEAVQLTNFGLSAGIEIDNLGINAMGTQVAFSVRNTVDEELWTANVGGASTGMQVVAASPGGDVVDGTVIWNINGFFYGYGSSDNANPIDARLWWYDTSFTTAAMVDGSIGSYWIFGVQ